MFNKQTSGSTVYFILCCPLVAARSSVALRHSEVTTGNMAASRKAAVVLKTVKKIAIRFSPFESNVRSTR